MKLCCSLDHIPLLSGILNLTSVAGFSFSDSIPFLVVSTSSQLTTKYPIIQAMDSNRSMAPTVP